MAWIFHSRIAMHDRWEGALSGILTKFAGHYPWFFVFNLLDTRLPRARRGTVQLQLRRAFTGFCASSCSYALSNGARAITTIKQTSPTTLTYAQAAGTIVKQDGVLGLLLGRGLASGIIANGIHGMLFTVLWKQLEDYCRGGKQKEKEKEKEKKKEG